MLVLVGYRVHLTIHKDKVVQVKIPRFEIDENDPFANDLLKRKPFADKLTNIIMANQNELVIALNGQWGEGKTTFINMWKAKLKLENYPCIYIDAFKIDYTEDAFVPIALAIDSFVEKELGSNNGKRQEFYSKSVEVGKRLLLLSGKIGLKALTLNVIDGSEFETLKGVGDDIAESFSEQFNSFAEGKLLSHQNNEELFDRYRQALTEVAEIAGHGEKPLIIVIDELDRCRHKFAVQILEKIKHFFSVKNVVFVLSVNQEQLEHSIKAEYGIGIDANTYLQKFIDIKATLPRFNITESSSWVSDYHEALINTYGLKDILKNVKHSQLFFELVARLLTINKISYRQSERVMLNIKILISSSKVDNLHYINLLLIAYVSYLVTIRPDIVKYIYEKQASYSDLIEISDFENVRSPYLEDTIKDLYRYISYCFTNIQEMRQDDGYIRFYEHTGLERGINSNALLGLIEILNSFSYLR